MAKDLVLDVIARKNTKDLSTLADEFDRLARETDDAGKRMHEMGTFSQYLDDQIAKTKVQVKALGDEFDRTGHKDVYASLRGSQSNLKSLERIKTDLTKALGDGGSQGGIQAGELFANGFRSAAGDFLGAAGPILAPAAVMLAAQIGATIGGGILAGAGLGALTAGLVAQLQDPRVKSAAHGLIDSIKEEFTRATSSLAEPLVQAFGILKADLAGPIGEMSGAFAHLAPYLEMFATYLGAAAEKFMPGFTRALEASGPIIGMIARELPTLANAFNIFFDEISKGGKGGGEAIDTLIKAVSLGIAGLGFVIRFASDMFDWFLRRIDQFTGLLAHLGGPFKDLHDYVHGIATSMDQGAGAADLFGTSVYGTKQDVDALTASTRALSSAFDDYFGKQMTADQAALKFKDDLFGLKDALDKHSHSIDVNSAAGVHNREIILGAISDAKAHRDALIAQAGGANASADAIAAANRTYEQDVAKLREMYVAANGSASAFDNLAGTYDVNIITRHIEVYTKDYQSYRQGERTGRAAGGPVIAGHAYVVGEERPEVFVPSTSGFVRPTTQAAGGSAAPRGEWRHTLDVAPGGDSAVATMFMTLARNGLLQIKSQWVTN